MEVTRNISRTSAIQIREIGCLKTNMLVETCGNLHTSEDNATKYKFAALQRFRQSYIKYISSQKIFIEIGIIIGMSFCIRFKLNLLSHHKL